MLMFLSKLHQQTSHLQQRGTAGHLEPPIEDIQQNSEDSGSLTAHNITMKKMMAEKVEPDNFEHHATN